MHSSWSGMKRLVVMKTQFNIERFDIIQGLKCGSFNTCLDNGNTAHALDYCTLLKRHSISYSVGYCFITKEWAVQSLNEVISNSSHAFPIY